MKREKAKRSKTINTKILINTSFILSTLGVNVGENVLNLINVRNILHGIIFA